MPGMVDQGVRQCLAGGIGGVNHAAMTVAAFTCQVEFALTGLESLAAEGNSQLLQPSECCLARYVRANSTVSALAQAGTGLQGVIDM